MKKREQEDRPTVPVSTSPRPSQTRSTDAIKLVMDGPITITLPPTLIRELMQSAAKVPVTSTETYDIASTELPMGRRKFRRGCREGWWPSWRGQHGRHTALKSDVDAWVRNHGRSAAGPAAINHVELARGLLTRKREQVARRRK